MQNISEYILKIVFEINYYQFLWKAMSLHFGKVTFIKCFLGSSVRMNDCLLENQRLDTKKDGYFLGSRTFYIALHCHLCAINSMTRDQN